MSGDVEILGYVCTGGGTVNCIVFMVTLIFHSTDEPSKVRIALRSSSSTSRFASKKNGKQWWDGPYLWSQHLGDEGKMRFLGHPQVGIKFEASLSYMKPCPFEINLRYMKPCRKNNIKKLKGGSWKSMCKLRLTFSLPGCGPFGTRGPRRCKALGTILRSTHPRTIAENWKQTCSLKAEWTNNNVTYTCKGILLKEKRFWQKLLHGQTLC